MKAAAVRDRPGGVSAFDRQFSWGEEYIRMLQGNHPWVKQVLELLAASEGVVLFHCFTGKDRTGLLAALLLGLCGVPREDVEADYAVSQIYLGDVYRWMREMIPDFRDRELSSPFFSTAPENIRLCWTSWRESTAERRFCRSLRHRTPERWRPSGSG